jgi:hypothetical protein
MMTDRAQPLLGMAPISRRARADQPLLASRTH